METLRRETEVAIGAVEKALDLARDGTGNVHFKEGRDVVTDTDLAVEDPIRGTLAPEFGWPVIGEERGGDAAATETHWLVDPICGTRNFASGIPSFRSTWHSSSTERSRSRLWVTAQRAPLLSPNVIAGRGLSAMALLGSYLLATPARRSISKRGPRNQLTGVVPRSAPPK